MCLSLLSKVASYWLSCCCLFCRGRVFATACAAIAFGAMKQGLLRGFDVGPLATPNFQSRLLDGAGKRKRQGPGQLGLETKIHGIQSRRSQHGGLSAGQKCNPRDRSGNRSPQTLHSDIERPDPWPRYPP